MKRTGHLPQLNGFKKSCCIIFVHFVWSAPDVMKDESHMMKNTVERIKKIMGGARNYGASPLFLSAITRTALAATSIFDL